MSVKNECNECNISIDEIIKCIFIVCIMRKVKKLNKMLQWTLYIDCILVNSIDWTPVSKCQFELPIIIIII